ncbi:NAD(P)-binding protein [Kordiimonas sp.]|uniref:NAD(P)/FAD-dependent oxidoreductase n=1 Tax=Kordiimonas sp. TaxID=1970157 RepID=UPI003A8DEC6B
MADRKKVAVLGGGVASLVAAYELSKTEAMREKYDVTIYQMGWRLGGKGATGRDEHGRIQEHGLHVWFGFYINAFTMLRDVYAVWERDDLNAMRTIHDALRPRNYTPLGTSVNDNPAWWDFTWPHMGGMPWDDNVLPTLPQLIGTIAGVIVDLILNGEELTSMMVRGKQVPWSQLYSKEDYVEAMEEQIKEIIISVKNANEDILKWVKELLVSNYALTPAEEAYLEKLLEVGHHTSIEDAAETLKILTGFHNSLPPNSDQHRPDIFVDVLRIILTFLAAPMQNQVLKDALDSLVPFAIGIISDFVIGNKTADELDAEGLEFTQWLVQHGGNPKLLTESHLLRIVYDTFMEFRDGDVTQPDYGAGVAAQVCVRLFFTSKHAELWNMQAGMGEVIIAPLYEVLKQNGVKVEFFHKVKNLGLDATGENIATIEIERQVNLKNGSYDPIYPLPVQDAATHLLVWPAQPLWDQIEDGHTIAAELDRTGSSLESHWNPVPPVGTVTLNLGEDFDECVLGIALGALKKLNEEPTMVDELKTQNTRFAAMIDNVGIIPTQAVQFWLNRDERALGWEGDRPDAVGGPEAFCIWADMYQTLKYEPWPGFTVRPRSVHYWCGVWKTDLYAQPSTDLAVPKQALEDVTANVSNWFDFNVQYFWPRATVTPGVRFDPDILFACNPDSGESLLSQQFIRPNVDPTECLTSSGAGVNPYKLAAGESGFDNLYLAGSWIKTGLNTDCVECATMSGMQAARALSGVPIPVPGEFFMQVKRP